MSMFNKLICFIALFGLAVKLSNQQITPYAKYELFSEIVITSTIISVVIDLLEYFAGKWDIESQPVVLKSEMTVPLFTCRKLAILGISWDANSA